MLIKRLMLTLAVALALQGCASSGMWYRGNTHAHSTNSDGDSAPEAVVQWYHDHGYNFMVLSDHNKFTDPQAIEFPAKRRDDFIMIPGVEVTGAKNIHHVAMNVTQTVPWNLNDDNKSVIVQSHVDGTIEAGGLPILAHPNFVWALTAKDIAPVERLNLFELYNGHPSVNVTGDATHPSCEAIWDDLLTGGMKIYGVASDDTHALKTLSNKHANPGRGWIMVQSGSLDADAITNAISEGEFYSSTGVFLKECKRIENVYAIVIDHKKTARELARSKKVGKFVITGQPGYTIQFSGPHGKVLKSVEGLIAAYEAQPDDKYVRVKITHRRKLATGGLEEFYAWGQPLFTNK